MDENFWTAYHPEQGEGTSLFSNLTPEDRKMLYRATGAIITPDGTSLGPGAEKSLDLVLEIAGDRAQRRNGLDATSPLTKDYLEALFAKYEGRKAFDVATLGKALDYLRGEDRSTGR